ncbi:Tripeptidyl-peptidase sed1 [Pseudocercospora fuligena]|uniref:tripeptidyl-peptidase II n=1 Tax=Pseudocercospora fuligena TaxID=685502 RepID=A0A8H6VL93_9PEZI|nr:Tripeptidyl-peptidase sed1 [Pseudocercospora fuligena]
MWGLLLSALAVTAAAAPTWSGSVVHEKRTVSQYAGRKTARVENDAIVPVRIGLTQRNLDRGYDYLMEVSHPSSKQYGKHWTAEEVDATFGPSDESVNAVLNWLSQSGISDAKKTATGWIAFEAPASSVEDLLEAQIHEYKSQDGTIRLGCDQYALPAHIAPHVDYLTPGVAKLSQPVGKTKVKRWGGYGEGRGRGGRHWGPPPSHRPPYWGQPWHPPGGGIPADLQACGRNITPPCLRALYDIPKPSSNIDSGILGIAEGLGDEYSQEDLNEYFSMYASYVPTGTHPALVSINGAEAPAPQTSAGGESDVDFDIAYALLGAAPITLYQIQPPANLPDSYTGDTLFGSLLDALDGSFCDDEDKSAGFQCGGAPLSSVTSISYGGPEFGNGYNVVSRACNEFMKLSLQGHTFVFATGDYGVAAHPPKTDNGTTNCGVDACLSRDLQTLNGPIFNPQYPAGCPYVLAVGATQLEADQTIRDAESVMYQPNIGDQQVAGCASPTTFFSSSGGFSNFFPRQKYQESAVSSYFANHDPGYAYYEAPSDGSFSNTTAGVNTGIYNRAGRAYPDVSANGAHFNLFVQGNLTQTYGTSLAAPIWSSLLAMINQQRQDSGKGPVGFVNAVLYEHIEIFHDIKNGSNPGCGTEGFPAVSGWDPSTGLGTSDYPTLEKVFLSLP